MKDFLTGKQVMERWKINRHELMKNITVQNMRGDYPFLDFVAGLTPWSPAYQTPYMLDIHHTGRTLAHLVTFPPLKTNHHWDSYHVIMRPGDIFNSLHETLFRIEDVNAWEALDGKKRRKESVRASIKHKADCREVAKHLWSENPSRTIEDLIRSDEINLVLEGVPYMEKTLRNWIKDFCPDRTPGRRPTAKK